jgi:tRNA dimethylallyltransferase
VRLAEQAIREVLGRGKIPLVVGGTGFYIRALADGLPTTPEADRMVQAELYKRLEQEGLDTLLKELGAFSSVDAKRTERNPRRVVRALEIIQRTGKAPTEFSMTKPAFEYDKIILAPTIEQLRPRIEKRTEEMFRAGLVDEVIRLFRHYPTLATAKQAIGYKEVVDYLAGQMSPEQAKDAVTLATTQYAKRQRTWFRKESGKVYEQLAPTIKQDVVGWLEGFRLH